MSGGYLAWGVIVQWVYVRGVFVLEPLFAMPNIMHNTFYVLCVLEVLGCCVCLCEE